jgi:hypothetical protein
MRATTAAPQRRTYDQDLIVPADVSPRKALVFIFKPGT